MKKPLRIAYGRLFHEANVFSPRETTLEDFERMRIHSGAELERASSLRGVELASFMPHAELTGFRQAMRLAGNVDCVPLTSAFAVPGGPMSRVTFEGLAGRLTDGIAKAGALDGVYLALHGAMQVSDLDVAPEAELLARVRAIVGPETKIAVSYDLHANLSEGLLAPVDVMVAYRTNPHWDLAPTGYRAGRRLVRAIRGEIAPVHAWRKLPMVFGGGTTISFLSPMRGVFRFMKDLEKDPRVVSASLFMVHPYVDAERIGWSVHVSTNDDAALAERLADDLADRAWATRKVGLPPMYEPASAIDAARKSFWRKLGPVTFVDVGDIVGAGAPGGNTRVAAALAAHGTDLIAYVPVHDPALVDATWDAPVGTKRAIVLRGSPGYDMPELALSTVVVARAETDFGRIVRLDAGKLSLVVGDRPPLPIHPSFWKAVGLDARRADVIVQKNFFHYRLFYATTSFSHLPVETEGATSLQRVRDATYDVPMAPRADLEDWRPYDPILRARVSSARPAPARQDDARAARGNRPASYGA